MRIAVLGIGLLGKPIAERLGKAGHSVVAYNRTREKTEGLQQSGIEVAGTPEEAVRAAECVILLLADAPAIESVLLSSAAVKELVGVTVIQMGTIGPDESRSFQRRVQAAGGHYLEAPVLGSIAEAQAGTLFVMAGSTPEQFERWTSLFGCLSQNPRHIGPVGAASALKLALNQLIAAEISAFSLSLGLVQREGVSPDAFMEILRGSALYAPTFDKKLPRLLAREFTNPNFSTRHMLKDVDLFLRAANQHGLDASGLAGIRQSLQKAVSEGLEDLDYSAVFNTINPVE